MKGIIAAEQSMVKIELTAVQTSVKSRKNEPLTFGAFIGISGERKVAFQAATFTSLQRVDAKWTNA